MNENILFLVEKIKQVLSLLGFSEEKKEEIFSELIDGVFKLALARTLEKRPDMAEKLKSIDTNSLTFENTTSLDSVFDQDTQSLFIKELTAIFDDYITQLVDNVDESKKGQIKEIWAIQGPSAN